MLNKIIWALSLLLLAGCGATSFDDISDSQLEKIRKKGISASVEASIQENAQKP